MNAPWKNPRALRVPVRIPFRLRLLHSPAGEKTETDFHNGNNCDVQLEPDGFFPFHQELF